MVDLGGYVIIIVETKDKKIKLYGSPADKEDLEVGDEILEVNGRSLENVTHTQVISHIHQCIRSRTICLRVKRRSGNKLALDLTTQHGNIQDAFVIAVEQQARERLEKLSQLEKIKPIDMTKLSHQLSEVVTSQQELNGLIKEVTGSPIYVTSVPELNQQQHNTPSSSSPIPMETSTASISPKNLNSPKPAAAANQINKQQTVTTTTTTTHEVNDNFLAIKDKIPTILDNLPSGASGMNGNHREMAVDVPDTFVPKTKTQPSYPKANRNVSQLEEKSPKHPSILAAAAVPEPKPKVFLKDDSKIKDLPTKKTLVQNGGVSLEMMDKILNAKKTIEISELMTNLQSIEEALNKNGFNYEEIIKPVRNLLHKTEFQKILEIYNRVYYMCCFNTLPVPVSLHLQELVQECIANLYNCSAVEAMELVNLFSKINFENIFYAYDKIAEREKLVTLSEFNCGESIDDIITRSPSQPEDNIKIVRIEKTHDPLGATVRNEGDTVVIGRIIKGGMAEKYGLNEGDEILEVNGIEMKWKTINDVCDILSHMSGTLTFLIIPNTKTQDEGKTEVMIHVRAQFNYNPKDDIYLPCHELGILFNKGDILHIINQDDLNWWQAHRDGEEEQLAGLIPSKVFQEQREMLKINMNEMQSERSKKSASAALLCTKGNKKKRKRVDDFSEDEPGSEIPTYEEVVLYYPSSYLKRPVILIGPPNIGRHELRQRLIQEFSERFAAAVPHTTRPQKDNEVNGQDYYFISRTQFEADINALKFIEYGEFEKSYYGTSIDSIKLIMNSNKTCVINLHPQSIKQIRNNPEIRPYIIFIAPASLERLKEIRVARGEAYKEDELLDIIQKANKMEYKYGHWFDLVIVNNDIELTYFELIQQINYIEHKPQWVPAAWNYINQP